MTGMDASDFDSYVLAQTAELLNISTREENRLAACRLAAQAARKLDLISRELDPLIYDSAEFIEMVRGLPLKNSFSEIRIVVAEPQSIVRRGHRLVNLAGMLSSFIQMRKLPKNLKNFGENILIVDETGYLQRENEARFDARVSFNDRRQSRVFSELFNSIWHNAEPDPNLRRMSL